MIYGSISYFAERKQENEIFQIISPRNLLEFYVAKDTVKKRLDFQITNIKGALPKIKGIKIYNFSLKALGKKRKAPMTEPIESVIVRGQQEFELHDVLNSVEIEINDDRITKLLKKHKNVYYKLTPINLFFPSLITNNTRQILLPLEN